ncbi:MAG: hypothetical protein EOP92_08880, partial [Lysobacteraceae bacterium]
MRTSPLLCATLLLSVVGLANTATADQASLPASPHQHASPPQAAMRSSPLSIPLDAAYRSALPRESVVITVEGNDVHCEGVALAALLRAAGALP